MENVHSVTGIQVLKRLLWDKSDGPTLDDLQPESVARNAMPWNDTSCLAVA